MTHGPAKTAEELKAIYGDPLEYRIAEGHYEWTGEGLTWLRHITVVGTSDGTLHAVDWTDRGHQDQPGGDFIHDEWVDGQGEHWGNDHRHIETPITEPW